MYELGLDIFHKDSKGFDVLHYAILMGKSDLVLDVLSRQWDRTRENYSKNRGPAEKWQ